MLHNYIYLKLRTYKKEASYNTILLMKIWFGASLTGFTFTKNFYRYTEFVIIIFQAKRIMEHKRKQERKKEERELRERKERIRKAKEENERARKVSLGLLCFSEKHRSYFYQCPLLSILILLLGSRRKS